MNKGKVTVFRYNPEIDIQPRYETYEFPYKPSMTVLDVAMYIYEQIDGSFSFSYACSNSHCGLCGAKINGKPGLMCREMATQEMVLEPLDNLTVIRDLMVDRDEYEKHKDSLRLNLDRVNLPLQEPEKIALKDLRRFAVASRCVECYSCISVCPSLKENPHEYLGPAGFVQLARHAFDPRDDLNREVIAYSGGLYNCTTCGRCTEVCPHDIAPSENIELLRARMVASGNMPRAVSQLIEMVEKTEKLIQKGKSSFIETTSMKKAKVGLFVGCNIDYDSRLQSIAIAALKVLQKMGIEVAVPQEQVCCGQPLKEVGAVEEIQKLVLKNVKAFEQAGCTTLITICSGCGVGAKKLWPGIYKEATGKDLPFEVMDFTEYVATLPFTDFVKPLNLKVAYHDPCTLKRGQGIYEEPRKILKSITKLNENAEDACCGGGGGLRVSNLKLSQRILKNRVNSFRNMDVQAIVTGCPTCIKQLNIGLAQNGMRKVEVLHTAVVMARAMGV
ncbi:fumarate reductase (CoM/CoB) subunit TfrB [Desulfitobacterium sp. AusDCA]|uniref:fumarate reductase (CoM/CoB) subunit TfrB n=1 Tax=Desulfitobacterium sp. AusDCA TaxID=3240383 RepID=UPI003DA77A33